MLIITLSVPSQLYPAQSIPSQMKESLPRWEPTTAFSAFRTHCHLWDNCAGNFFWQGGGRQSVATNKNPPPYFFMQNNQTNSSASTVTAGWTHLFLCLLENLNVFLMKGLPDTSLLTAWDLLTAPTAWDCLNRPPSTWACGVLAEKQQQLFC